MANVVIDILTQFKGKKAFDQANKSTDKLSKSVKSLGKALGVGLSVAAVTAFGKASVKAFAEDEAAAAKLAKVVDNLGIGFANVEIAKFISDLESTSGVLDDSLRPAFQALLTTTGSLENSQKLLSQAIDVSRGSTVDLVTVADDLGKAYVGNTRGLVKYNLGLTKAELATMSFAEIQAKLNEQFTGSNAAYLETYAGKMDILKVSADNAKEAIGKGIVDALSTLAGDSSIIELGAKIQGIATGVADFIRGFAIGLRDLANLPFVKQLLQLVTFLGQKIYKATAQVFIDSGAAQRLEQEKLQRKSDLLTAKQKAAALAKLEADAKKRALELAKIAKKKTDEEKKAAALKKASNLFDMDQIQIIAALQGKLTDEERNKLKLQLAILTENTTEASKLAAKVAEAQGLTKGLVAYYSGISPAKSPFDSWIVALLDAEAIQKRILALSPQKQGNAVMPETVTPEVQSILDILTQISFTQGPGGDLSDYINLDGPNKGKPMVSPVIVNLNVDGRKLTDAITADQTNDSLSGNKIAVNRLNGSFE
jgi:hypothetical protein